MKISFEEKLNNILQIPAVKLIFARLEKELSKDLYYHNYQHTVDVLREAVSFAVQDGLSEREIQLIGVAAAFHDSGFLFQRENNEKLGAELALDMLGKDGGYSKEELAVIETMILDTEVIRPATHKLSKYLIDADLSNFGREDFFDKCELIIRENKIKDRKDFYQKLTQLLTSHAWYTAAAKKTRQSKKEENLTALGQLIF